MDIQQRTNRLYGRAAPTYDAEPGHGILSEAEWDAWRADLAPYVARIAAGGSVLDVGTGTGVAARLLAERGFRVQGIDPAPEMVARADELLPDRLRPAVSFRVGDTIDAGLVPAASFDAVVCRQVVCHLTDPLAAFRNWRAWLRPDGVALVIDAFWPRSDWASGELGELIDELPLSCVQTMATLAYLLQVAGFHVLDRRLLTAVNETLRLASPDASEPALRYAVLAARPPDERGSRRR